MSLEKTVAFFFIIGVAVVLLGAAWNDGVTIMAGGILCLVMVVILIVGSWLRKE